MYEINNNNKILPETKLDYEDVLLIPRPSTIRSRAEVNIETQLFGLAGVPVIAANMDGVGTFDMARELAKYRCFTALTKHYSVEDLVRFFTDTANADIIPFTIYSMGTSQEDFDKLVEVSNKVFDASGDMDIEPKIVCVDVANGYSKHFLDCISLIRETFPSIILIAGNVCTREQTRAVIREGANYAKIGVGPGSVCTTRLVAGVGYPQFSAVMECAQAAYEAQGAVIADGGCQSPGDVAKALGAGAAAVMLGGMFAGHAEGGFKNTGQHTSFHGMASQKAQELHNGGLADYRSSEGREVAVPYRGNVSITLRHVLGGLRSSMSYVGARTIEELHQKATFVKTNHHVNSGKALS
jgi:GMP reductase